MNHAYNLSVEDKISGSDNMGLGCFPSVAVRNENSVNHGVVRAGYVPSVGASNYGRQLPLILSILPVGSLPPIEVIR